MKLHSYYRAFGAPNSWIKLHQEFVVPSAPSKKSFLHIACTRFTSNFKKSRKLTLQNEVYQWRIWDGLTMLTILKPLKHIPEVTPGFHMFSSSWFQPIWDISVKLDSFCPGCVSSAACLTSWKSKCLKPPLHLTHPKFNLEPEHNAFQIKYNCRLSRHLFFRWTMLNFGCLFFGRVFLNFPFLLLNFQGFQLFS